MNRRFLTRGMLNVLTANLINLFFNLLTNFLLPKYLSIDAYADIKTYQLYCVYAGLLHFGFVDGMFLKYGGVHFSKINKRKLIDNLATIRTFQIMVFFVAFFWGLFIKNNIWMAFVFSILPLNLAHYFKFLYQASGEFILYGRLMNLITGAIFFCNMLLLFFSVKQSMAYLIAYVAVNIVIWILLEVHFSNICNQKMKLLYFSFMELKNSVRDGFLLMIGNFTSSFLVSMDRWFIKVLFSTNDFAQYSFAVSVESVLNVAITPVTVTLYHFFCSNKEKAVLIKCRNYVSVFSTIIVAAAFPAKLILEVYLTEYLDAVSVVFYLFAAQMLYIVIKAVYINLYKARCLQKKYFKKLCIVTVFGFGFNIMGFVALHTKEAFALATLLTAIIWFLLSTIDFPELKYKLKHYIYFICEMIVFISCGIYLDAINGFFVYCTFTAAMILLIFKNDFLDLWRKIEK